MHFFYIDKAGNTGGNLATTQQLVFEMASLIVSDEKWRKYQPVFCISYLTAAVANK